MDDTRKPGPFPGGYVTQTGYVRYDHIRREYVRLLVCRPASQGTNRGNVMTNELAEAIVRTMETTKEKNSDLDRANVVDALLYIGDALHRLADIEDYREELLDQYLDESKGKPKEGAKIIRIVKPKPDGA